MKSIKKSRKKEDGITLIALVITIIVLLILAGVSIATLTAENGILRKSFNFKRNNRRKTGRRKTKVSINRVRNG